MKWPMPGGTFPAIPLLLKAVRRPLVVFALLATMAVQIMVGWMHQDARQTAFESSIQTLEGLTFALAEHVDATFEHGDQMLRAARHQYMRDALSLPQLYEAHNVAVDRRSFPLEAVIRPDGRMFLSTTSPRDFEGATKVDLKDREHFRVHVSSEEDKLFVSKPIVGRVSGKPVMNMSRRIMMPDGAFGGVAVVSVSPENFVAPYRRLVGNTGVIAIYGRDGVARVRITSDRTEASMDISKSEFFSRMLASPRGHYVAVSSVDGQKRLYAYQSLANTPLLVVTGFGLDELEQRHATGVQLEYRALTAISLVGMLLLCVSAFWTQALQIKLEEKNAELVRRAADALAASAAKTRFLSGVSHELRTPLHGISGHAQMLAMDVPEGPMREDAESILRNAQHLRKLVDELLDLAKAESGAQRADWLAIDPVQALEEVAALHRASTTLRKIELQVVVKVRPGQQLVSDPLLLKRVLHNLADNAIKFTAVGKVTLRLEKGPGGFRFEVTDTGAGIPPDRLPHIFELYQRSEADTAGRIGSGLGLALAHRLVGLLGGELQVVSQLGKGSTFGFSLPSRPAETEGGSEDSGRR
jgi:signal transduction histidine kinase